uniref:Smoothelin-like isoform X1 n=1 Tax=Petromyzon marinus TaxID=7757 RepID=A0AAJ7TTC7_PETMA|nr:smoothelin-like isoform X1 [Petromyzon marinus]XP_032823704.1 smoothelin-like isoform X1 [Petromyzon marinus]XP_032823705.1 smoothelin-like isoform X1 [Petromyzon marinus]
MEVSFKMPAADIAALGNNNPRIQTHVLGAYSEGPLHSAVQEISIDLHGFKKAVDKKVEEMARQMGPLIKMINDLRDENMRLRAEQTRLAGRVEMLTKLLGVDDRAAAPLATVAAAAPSAAAATAYERPTSAVAVALDGAGSQKSAFNTTLKIKLETEPSKSSNQPQEDSVNITYREAVVAGVPKAEPFDTNDVDEEVLERMLAQATDFEERRGIRTAIRNLRKKARGVQGSVSTDDTLYEESVAEEQRESIHESKSTDSSRGLQKDVVVEKLAAAGDKGFSKTEKVIFGDSTRSVKVVQKTISTGNTMKKSILSTVESNYSGINENTIARTSNKSVTFSTASVLNIPATSGEGAGTHTTPSPSFKTPPGSQERQMGGRLELMRSQSLPRTPNTQSRKALFQKLEQDASWQSSLKEKNAAVNSGGGVPAGGKAAPLQRSASASLPDATTIKQTILDWVRSKTDRYENVTIKNFSSSWCDGMAFCALVHSYFPEAFDFAKLSPQNPRHNFQLAFTCAEQLAHCDPLLDVDDMIMMGKKPDSKCVFTYVQSLYNKLRRLERMMEKAQQQH